MEDPRPFVIATVAATTLVAITSPIAYALGAVAFTAHTQYLGRKTPIPAWFWFPGSFVVGLTWPVSIPLTLWDLYVQK